MSRRSALELIDDWLATGFRARHDAAPELEPRPTRLPRRPPRQPRSGQAALDAIAGEVAACTRCQLSMNRTRVVPGEGSLDPPVLFVGEGPGEEEDRTGRPFVGAAGKYLDKWIVAGGARAATVLSSPTASSAARRRTVSRTPTSWARACRTSSARSPSSRPGSSCCLGRIAAQTLLGTSTGVGALRGKVHDQKGHSARRDLSPQRGPPRPDPARAGVGGPEAAEGHAGRWLSPAPRRGSGRGVPVPWSTPGPIGSSRSRSTCR